jgi:hypothetical protein
MSLRLAILVGACLVGLVVMGSSLAIVFGGGGVSTGPVLYLSPAGSDGNPCTKARPCLSFARAWNASRAGQTIELAAGTYGHQLIRPYSGSSRADVVFQPAKGAKVVVGGVDIEGSHIEFRDLRLGGWKTIEPATDVTFRNVATASFFIWSASHVRLIGGSVGPNLQATFDSQITTNPGSQTPPSNILIDGVRFHDWVDADPGQGNHIECLQVGSGVNVTIRNSRFERCGTHDIFLRSWGSLSGGVHPLRNWLLENNFFGSTLQGFFAMQIAEGADPAVPCENFLVRNNSFLQDIYVSCPAGGANGVRVESNILPSMAAHICKIGGSRWDYNVYGKGTRCGSKDRIGAVRFVDPARLDLRLRPRSAAIDRGNPNSFPKADIEGQRRPSGKGPDAGADERVAK